MENLLGPGVVPESRRVAKYIIKPAMARGLLIGLVVVVILVGGTLAWAGSVSNQLAVADQNVNENWAQVQNAYPRRAGPLPNLAATVKGFAALGRTSRCATPEP